MNNSHGNESKKFPEPCKCSDCCQKCEESTGCNCNNSCECGYNRSENHNHEIIGSTRQLEKSCTHIHKVIGTTGQAVNMPNSSHYHEVNITTDFYIDHMHTINVKSGPAVDVGGGRHVHLIYGTTNLAGSEKHEFLFTTSVENMSSKYTY